MDGMDMLACIKERRSVRAYRPDPVDDERVASLLEAASWAPSGSNRQSWLFTAIVSEQKLAALNAVVREAFLRSDPDDKAFQHHRAAAARYDYNFFYRAPVLIVASAEQHPNAFSDCACALQNIFLAAHAMGLGSCWINQLRWLTGSAPVRDALADFGIPKEHLICGGAAVGYAAKQPPAPPRREGVARVVR